MAEKVTCEIFIAMNEDGNWIVESEESEALSKLAEDQGGYHARVVKITVKMTPPGDDRSRGRCARGGWPDPVNRNHRGIAPILPGAWPSAAP